MFKLLIATLISLSAIANAAEIYPAPLPVRFSGHHQGNTGSCQAEAYVGALEHAFAARRYTVKLSAAYNHAFNWQGKSSDLLFQDYNGNDAGIFGRYGAIVPYFLLPEDGRGFNASASGNRPAVSTIINDVTGFPAAPSVGFSSTYYSFQPNWSNSMRDFNTVKTWVSQKQAVTLSLHSEIFNLLDDRTGLLTSAYSFATFSPTVKPTNHAVAIVGFDDSLYAGQGAFIVRNSWNENYGMASTQLPMDLNDPNLQLMKAKISKSFIEPGYYALPYQYVADLINQHWPGIDRPGEGGVNFLNVDYTSYAAHYNNQESAYEVRRIPFACSLDGIKVKLLKYKIYNKNRRGPDSGATQMAAREWKKILEQQRKTPYQAIFQTALVSRAKNRSIDRFRDFEKGTYNAYYCPSGGTVALPPEVINDARFDELVNSISLDPSGLGPWMRFYDYMIEALKI